MVKLVLLAPVLSLWLALLMPTNATDQYFLRLNVTIANNSESVTSRLCGYIVTWPLIGDLNEYSNITCNLLSVSDKDRNIIVILHVAISSKGYGWFSFKYAMDDTIYEQLFRQSRNKTIDGESVEIHYMKIYAKLINAANDVNAEGLLMCDIGLKDQLCETNKSCIASSFEPHCTETCAYGQYSSGDHCLDCPPGKRAFKKEAFSIDDCIDDCSEGHYYSFLNSSCVTCSDDMYWSAEDKVCHVCPYVTYNSTHCENGTQRNVDEQRINIDLDLLLITSTCPYIIDTLDIFLFSGFVCLYERDYNIFRDLCLDTDCYNVQFKAINDETCVKDSSCSNNTTCDILRTDVHLTIIYAKKYIQPLDKNKHNRSTVDVLLQYLYDIKPGSWRYVYPRFQLLTKPRITYVDIEQSRIYVKFVVKKSWPDEYYIQNVISSLKTSTNIGLLTVENITKSDCDLAACFNFSLLFKTNVNDIILYKFAEYIIHWHEKSSQSSQNLNITGPILISRNLQEMEMGINAINWCKVINSLSLAASFCERGNFCVNEDIDGNFLCIEDSKYN